jgi:hypothetical protein
MTTGNIPVQDYAAFPNLDELEELFFPSSPL